MDPLTAVISVLPLVLLVGFSLISVVTRLWLILKPLIMPARPLF